jgi:hypothetical protein
VAHRGDRQVASVYDGDRQAPSVYDGDMQAPSVYDGDRQAPSVYDGDRQEPSVYDGDRQAPSVYASLHVRLSSPPGADYTLTFLWACRKTAEYLYSRPRRPEGGIEVYLSYLFNIGARWRRVVNATLWPL